MRFDLHSAAFVDEGIAPDRLALAGADRNLSWSGFRAAVDAWVIGAGDAGVGPDIPLVIYGHKEAQFLVAMAGCLRLNAPFVPVDEIYPEERLQKIAAIVRAPAIYRAATRVFQATGYPPRALPEEDLAYVMFTSGSTGEPKGVQIGREGVGGLVEWMRSCFRLGPAPVFMNQAPFSFDLSMYEVFGFLGLGGSIVLNSRELVAQPRAYLERLAQHAVNVWVSTPSFARQQLLNKQFSAVHLPELETFLFCGETLPVTLARELRQRFPAARILNTYGPTEATVATTWMFIDDEVLARHDPLPVGYAKPGSMVRVDPANGEIEILGNHVMRGYLNREDLNQGKMFEEAGTRGFRTGDLGAVGPDGLLFCRGRRDDQIKLHGYRIELSEVDRALQRLAGIGAAAAVPLRRADGSVARLIAYVTFSEGSRAPADWKQQLAAWLPPYMIPSELLPAGDLPVSANGKIDRKALELSYLRSFGTV